ncbi:trehalose-phosphatase [Phenylobacterium sp.]|uniref:trehalose-phosphatase n=1 Tax=Phenylobacterium sp. TaxID=1871053 RepID=UPI0035B1EA75
MKRPVPISEAARERDADWPGPDRMALFLDVDGTLAPIETRPHAVGPVSERNVLLGEVARRLHGRAAIVSGRTIADVDRILDHSITAVAGVHGLERRTALGRQMSSPAHPALVEAKRALQAFAAADSGLEVEDKALSVALHFRRAPGAAEAVRDLAGRLSAATGLSRQDGDCVIELRTPGPSKGDAVAAFMAEPPFAGAAPVFVGDDLTDEDAFRAAVEAGGFGVLVGPPRDTWATHRLASVDEVLAWLRRLARRDETEAAE